MDGAGINFCCEGTQTQKDHHIFFLISGCEFWVFRFACFIYSTHRGQEITKGTEGRLNSLGAWLVVDVCKEGERRESRGRVLGQGFQEEERWQKEAISDFSDCFFLYYFFIYFTYPPQFPSLFFHSLPTPPPPCPPIQSLLLPANCMMIWMPFKHLLLNVVFI